MSQTPFMPLWVSDFLGDTLELDATEVGAYMLLLMAQWNRDGASLPNDQKKLQRVARCGRSWPKIWANISRYFSTDEGGIYSKRLRLEAQNVASKRNVNAQNGARGGAAKALKNNEHGLANATNSPKRNAGIPEPEPELKDSGANAPDGGAVEDATDAVWGKCREWLIEAAGIPDKEARPLIGKWLKQADSAQQVREAFVSAFKARTKDPVSYITKTIQPKPSPADENIAFLRAAAGE